MIGRLTGLIVDISDAGTLIVDVQGVGYEVRVPAMAFERLRAQQGEVTLFVHTHVREDAMALFGFETKADRSAFRTLLSVSNVGPKLALAILSALDARNLAHAIGTQNKEVFSNISGVGKKTAERLLIELRDKLDFVMELTDVGGSLPPPVAANGPLDQRDLVLNALIQMGYKRNEAAQALGALPDSSAANTSVEVMLRAALAQLS